MIQSASTPELQTEFLRRIAHKPYFESTLGTHLHLFGNHPASGWAFYLLPGSAVLELRGRRPDVRLVAAVPFRGQEARFPQADRERFGRVLAAADAVEVLSPVYHRGCYAVRNDFLVDHARVLVAWYDGSPGGTRYTVRRALGRGLEILDLHPAAPALPAPAPTLFG